MVSKPLGEFEIVYSKEAYEILTLTQIWETESPFSGFIHERCSNPNGAEITLMVYSFLFSKFAFTTLKMLVIAFNLSHFCWVIITTYLLV